MEEERLEDFLARLEDERSEADERYNAALTAVDQAVQRQPELPHPPPPYDETLITPINLQWDILPNGAPQVDGSLKGRLRSFIWRIVGPPLEHQKGFNSALVDHLNRNRAAHREAAAAATALIHLMRDHIEGLLHFQHRLIGYLQTVTLYVDTKDRSSASFGQILNATLDAVADDWLKRWESLTAREQRIHTRVSEIDDLRGAVAAAHKSAFTLLNETVRTMTNDWLKRWESLAAREQRLNARVAAVDDLRASTTLVQQTSLTLKREVERLLEGARQPVPNVPNVPNVPDVPNVPAADIDLDSFKYVAFEDSFRGSRDDIRARLEGYLPVFDGLSDVLDIGCGRGEFLDLLRERGISARGIDLNHEMVEVSQSRGLSVTKADALGYVRQLADGSLGGVFAAQVVEHLEPSYLMQLVETCFHKLRAGGVIVLETINPACWLAFFESYIRDLTHVRPLHPETLQYLLRVSGFQNVAVEYKSPVAESSRLQPIPPLPHNSTSPLVDLVNTFNENVAKLNARMFTYQDYAVIGRR